MSITPQPEANSPKPAPRVVVVKDWPLRRALAGYVALLMLGAASVITIMPLYFKYGEDIPITPAVIATVLAELLVIFWALYYTGQLKGWKQALGLHKFTWKRFLGGMGIGVLLLIGLQLVAVIGNTLSPGAVESSDTSNSLGALPGLEKYIVLLILIPFVVPFVEEVFFRGYVFRFIANSNLKGKVGPLVGIAVSSVFFALAHYQGLANLSDYMLMGWILVVGAINALLVYKTDSVFTAYGSHLAYNLGTVMLILFVA